LGRYRKPGNVDENVVRVERYAHAVHAPVADEFMGFLKTYITGWAARFGTV
jgi:hypothetical protein